MRTMKTAPNGPFSDRTWGYVVEAAGIELFDKLDMGNGLVQWFANMNISPIMPSSRGTQPDRSGQRHRRATIESDPGAGLMSDSE